MAKNTNTEEVQDTEGDLDGVLYDGYFIQEGLGAVWVSRGVDGPTLKLDELPAHVRTLVDAILAAS